MFSGNLWYHDGTGFGWPAMETRRTEETRDATEKATRQVTREITRGARKGEYETVDEEYDAPLGYTITTITRDLMVFYTGPASNKAAPDGSALAEGMNVLRDVPEGAPMERGTCSHIAWQPGTPEHAAMVTHGLAEGAEALDAELEQLKLRMVENQQALLALKERQRQVAQEHGLDA